jgi:hypothetical protein
MSEHQWRKRHEQDKLGDAPIQKEYSEQMNDLARALDMMFNGIAVGDDRKTGFVLMVFPFGDEGRCNYISNALRKDVITLLKEQLKRFEGQSDVSGTA